MDRAIIGVLVLVSVTRCYRSIEDAAATLFEITISVESRVHYDDNRWSLPHGTSELSPGGRQSEELVIIG
jgi:hypothetical protein